MLTDVLSNRRIQKDYPDTRRIQKNVPDDQKMSKTEEGYEDLLGSRPFVIEYLLGYVWMSTLGALALN